MNNDEAHGPTDYHAYMLPYPTDRNNSCGPTRIYVMYVLVWLDPPLSLRMHVNSNYNGNYHGCTHAIQCMEREGSSHTRLHIHVHT